MTGETDLDRLIAGMDPVLDAQTYLFVTVPPEDVPAGLSPRMRFEEEEGTTLIVAETDAAAHGLAGVFPCRRITLRIHSALEAVGFIAAVAARLTQHGIGANPVSGYHHDHLFVAADQAEQALQVLKDLAAGR